MKIDFSQALMNLNNEHIWFKGPVYEVENGMRTDKLRTPGTPLTLGIACVEALQLDFEGERIDGGEKLKRFLLATKIHGAGEIEVTAEEVVQLKTLVGKAWPVPVVGRAMPLLNG